MSVFHTTGFYPRMVIVLLLFLCTLTAQAGYTAREVVRYAKALDVAKLDPTLSSQRLDAWLRSGPPDIDTVMCRISNCDLRPDFSDPNYIAPLCVKIRFRRAGVAGWIIIRIGTFRNGINGAPYVEDIIVVSENRGGPNSNSKKLSDFPRLLDEASSSTGGR